MKSRTSITPWLIAALASGTLFATSPAVGQPLADPAVWSADGENLGGLGPAAFASLPPWLGRGGPTLLATYPQFDYWSLDTSGVRDGGGNLHFAVRLWEYNNQTDNYDRYVLSPAGELIETHLDWYGLGGLPIFVGPDGHNETVRPVATSSVFGVVDSADYSHMFYTMLSGGWEVAYKKLDPEGNTVIDWTQITVGADPWNWYLQPVITSTDTIIVTWNRDTEDICAVSSMDGGTSWSDITVLLDLSSSLQHAMVKTVVDRDDCLHLVWRPRDVYTQAQWLYYAKLYPDWSVCVDVTPFHSGNCWYPFVSLDDQDSLHVTFGTTYDVGTTLYYTRLRGDLDLGGDSGSDALLTAIPERPFVTDADTVRYPVNLPDGAGAVHVIYEEGTYGRGTDKDVYYIRLCTLPGDLNCDDVVNFDDFAIFADCLNGPGAAAPSGCDPTDFAKSDLDDDDDVDLADFAQFQTTFTGG